MQYALCKKAESNALATNEIYIDSYIMNKIQTNLTLVSPRRLKKHSAWIVIFFIFLFKQAN